MKALQESLNLKKEIQHMINENGQAPEAKEFMGSEKPQAAKGENGLAGSVETGEGTKTPESKEIKTMLDRMKTLANIKTEKPDLQWDDAGISTPGSLVDQPKEVDPVDVVRAEKATGAPSIEVLKQELRPENPIITKSQPKADSSSSSSSTSTSAPAAEKSEESGDKKEWEKPWEKKEEKSEEPKEEKSEEPKEEKEEDKEKVNEEEEAIEEIHTHHIGASQRNVAGNDEDEINEEEEVVETSLSDEEILESEDTELMAEAMVRYKNDPTKLMRFKRRVDEIRKETRLNEALNKMRRRF